MAIHAEASDLSAALGALATIGHPERPREDLRRRRPRAAATTEFARVLDATGITQSHASRLFRVTQRHVRRWRHADRPVPVGVDILLRLMVTGVITLADIELAAGLIPARTNGNGHAKPELSEPTSTPAPAPAPAGEAVLALTPASCRWPIGHPRDPDFCFCGDLIAAGSSYCARHHGEAHMMLPARPTARRVPDPGADLAPALLNNLNAPCL